MLFRIKVILALEWFSTRIGITLEFPGQFRVLPTNIPSSILSEFVSSAKTSQFFGNCPSIAAKMSVGVWKKNYFVGYSYRIDPIKTLYVVVGEHRN